jgi:hypothetical protein
MILAQNSVFLQFGSALDLTRNKIRKEEVIGIGVSNISAYD